MLDQQDLRLQKMAVEMGLVCHRFNVMLCKRLSNERSMVEMYGLLAFQGYEHMQTASHHHH